MTLFVIYFVRCSFIYSVFYYHTIFLFVYFDVPITRRWKGGCFFWCVFFFGNQPSVHPTNLALWWTTGRADDRHMLPHNSVCVCCDIIRAQPFFWLFRGRWTQRRCACAETPASKEQSCARTRPSGSCQRVCGTGQGRRNYPLPQGMQSYYHTSHDSSW